MDVAKKETKVLAVDFGASSGRVMLGTFDGNKITAKEIHRFSNDPVIVNGTMYWDVLRLFHEIKQGLIKAKGLWKRGQHRRGYLGRGLRPFGRKGVSAGKPGALP